MSMSTRWPHPRSGLDARPALTAEGGLGRRNRLGQKLTLLFSCLFLCWASWAQETNLLRGASPKLSKFLAEHPTALKALNHAFSDAFQERTVGLQYFYSEDEHQAKAFHFYPQNAGLPQVLICVRENQCPLDEFIGVIFEIVNSKGEARFKQIVERGKAGTISRTEFARAILKVEFDADKTIRDLLRRLELREKDKAKSYYYGRYRSLPDDFEGYLSFIKRVSPKRDAIGDYELQYDIMRKHQ